MPELPEVETIARTLQPQVQDCVIAGCYVLRPSSVHGLSLPLQCLLGQRIARVGRRGKLLLLHLASQDSAELVEGSAQHAFRHSAKNTPERPAVLPDILVFHLRMTGSLMTHPHGMAPHRHTRIVFDLHTPQGEMRRLFFDDTRAFGLALASTEEIRHAWSFWRKLGPEPLGLAPEIFAARLAGRGAAIKAALLDQKIIAGVGNIYADESLFAAGIDPRRRACELTPHQCRALLQSLQAVLRLSIEQCGSSIRNYRDANGNAGAFQNSFVVYGRGGAPCVRCGRPLVKIRVAGRGTVVCPHCQT